MSVLYAGEYLVEMGIDAEFRAMVGLPPTTYSIIVDTLSGQTCWLTAEDDIPLSATDMQFDGVYFVRDSQEA